MPPASDGQDGHTNNQNDNRRRNNKKKRNKPKRSGPRVELPDNPVEGIKKNMYFQLSNKPNIEPFSTVAKAVIDWFCQKHLDQAYFFRNGYKTFALQPLATEPQPGDTAYTGSAGSYAKAHYNWILTRDKRRNSEATLCSMIEAQCTASVMTKLRGKSAYDSIETACDSMGLLLLVQAVCAEQSDTRPAAMSKVDVTKALLNFHQGEKTNTEYYDHFLHRANTAVAANCSVGASVPSLDLIYAAGNITAPTAANKTAATTEAREQFLASLFIANSAKRYDSLRRELENNAAMNPGGSSPYPVTVRAALELITEYKPPRPKNPPRNPTDREGLSFYQGGGTDPDRRGRPGRGRGRPGRGRESRGRDGRGREARGRSGRGGRGRETDDATSGSRHPQQDTEAHAHHNRAEEGAEDYEYSEDNYSSDDSEDYCTTLPDEDVYETELLFLHSGAKQRRHPLPSYVKRRRRKVLPKHWVILDTGSTASIFSNSRLLHDIHEAERPLIVRCNAGTVRLTHQGYFGSYPVPVWYNPSGIANILSKFEVAKHYEVSYHNRTSDDYIITTGTGTIRFKPTKAGLYYKDFARDHRDAWAFFETVKGQKSQFTKKDVRRAARARKIQNIIGRPGLRQFKDILDKQLLPHSELEVRDLNNAEKIYGTNLGSLKGKTTATTNTSVRTTTHDLPPYVKEHHSDVTVAIDIMFINKVPFLVTISRGLKFGTVEQLPNRQIKTVVAMIKSVLAIYERRGLKVNTILADLEFEPLKTELPGITIDCCAVDDHVPEVERYIRTIKDRCRSVYNMLPFGRIPRLILRRLVGNAVFWLNSFPALDGVSATQSPRELVTGKRLLEKRHVRAEFGAYVQTHEEHDNTMQSRTIGAICLGPTGSSQGAHYFLNIATGSRITRQHWTELPMPTDVIQRITALGAAQSMPQTLTFADRHGKELIDDDDEEDDDHDSDYNSDDDSDQSSHEDDANADDDSDDDDDDDDEAGNDNNNNSDSDDDSVEYVATRRLLQPSTAGVNADDNADNVDNADATANNEPRPPAVRELRFALPEDRPATPPLQLENEGVRRATAGVDPEIAGVRTANAGVDPTNTGVEPDPDAELNARIDATTNELAAHLEEGTRLLDSTQESTHSGNDEDQAATGNDEDQEAITDDMNSKYGPRNHTHGLRPRSQPDFSHLKTMFHVQVCLLTDQMSAKRGLKVFGKGGADAIVAEMHQVHYRKVIKPVWAHKMTRDEKRNALKYLMFLKQKRCGKIKARGCADGRKQRLWKTKEETSAPTVRTESCFMSCTIDAMEGRVVYTIDVPGAFMQADIDELVHVKFEGELAELLVKVDPKTYRKYVAEERGKKVIYVELQKALYGTLQGALLFWKNLSSFLVDELGFKLNPYDTCVANKDIDGSQCTILWHVDDLKMSHKDPKVMDAIHEKLNAKYGKEAPLTVQRGKVHEYLGMTIDYSIPGKVQFRMDDYIKRLLEEAPEDMKGVAATPAANHLFKINKKNPSYLDNKQADFFHHMVAKLLYLCKRVRPDIMTAVAFLTTRVSKPDTDDYAKLSRCMKYIRRTKDLNLTLEVDGSGTLQWWVDASFAVHMDMKSHTGAILTLGKGGAINISTKQKIMTDSSTTAELVAVHDILPMAIWTRKFLEAQGYKVTDNVVYQDNQSAILLEENGRKSCGRRTRHLDIRYFYAADLVTQKELRIEFCPTGQMLADFFTKPLQGSAFRRMRDLILNTQQPYTP